MQMDFFYVHMTNKICLLHKDQFFLVIMTFIDKKEESTHIQKTISMFLVKSQDLIFE